MLLKEEEGVCYLKILSFYLFQVRSGYKQSFKKASDLIMNEIDFIQNPLRKMFVHVKMITLYIHIYGQGITLGYFSTYF